jgi:hypothetical protein
MDLLPLPTRRPPWWGRIAVAAATALAFLGASILSLYWAMYYSWSRLHPPGAFRQDTTRAVLLMVVAMLFVVGAIVVPLIIRNRAAQAAVRAGRRSAAAPTL